MSNYYSIGEMSKLNKVSIQTLRYYDQIGLLKPVYVDKESNYRYYSIDQFPQLDLIKYLKYLGMPLKDIKSKLSNSDEEMLDLLNNKIETVNENILELQTIKRILSKKKELLERTMKEYETDIIFRKHIPMRSILQVEYENCSYKNHEMSLARRELANIMEENISVFYGGVSGIIDIDKFIENKEVKYKGSFLVIEKELSTTKNKLNIRDIESGDFICVRYTGNYENNHKYIQQLMDYIEYKRIPVENYIYEISIIDPMSTNDESKLLTEIQIPVVKREIDLRCLV
ncbi:MerR family transcriptional regulator [Romboutsia sp.]|uniref:MerR family transcriptional regulator n=1 Tax=Romboutsia sp. TaxID=1965302 RepID=UPI003F3048F1